MKANTKNKKSNTIKKIVPAAGMLAISASMLATSTYAWFTMSREVEIQNIQLTATTPEDIQISLGAIGSASDSTSLAASTGYLTATNGVVSAPTTVYDWSNIADISHYYSFGKLIPASSTTGSNIFFTPDANGVGKTLKDTAKFYTAANAATAVAESAVGNTSSTNSLNATSHVNSATAWTPTGATGWNSTNDDGYYIDIPVWLRTSSTEGATLSVEAVVYDNTTSPNFGVDNAAASDGKELYKAVRVAVLTEAGAAATTNNIIGVTDGGAGATSGTYGTTSVVDYYAAAGTGNPQGAGAISAVASQGATTATYAAVTEMTAGTTVATLAAGTGTTYGTPTKVIVRVWLEGEDPDCWNETAGQDWSISLKFNNETTNSTI